MMVSLSLVLHLSGKAAAKNGTSAGSSNNYEIVFSGNKVLSDSELQRAAAAELQAFATRGHRRSDIDDAAFQMEIAYRQAGYAFARVDYELHQEKNTTRATFIISEGPRVIIANIAFVGNKAVDQQTLLQFFEGSRAGLLGKKEHLFVRSEVENAVASIRQFYHSQGYLEAKVADPEYEFSEDQSKVDITIAIQEGVQYKIHRIKFLGDVLAGAKNDLAKLQQDMIGQPYFNRQKLLLQTRILEIYGNLGYPDAVITIDRKPSTTAGRVALDVIIKSGPLVTIVKIEIHGNVRTRASFIRKRLMFKAGSLYNLNKRKESFRNLYRTGIFSRVDLKLQETNEPDKRVLLVTVEEVHSKELYFEPGWGSYERLRLRLGFREKNLFGSGRTFGSEATGSQKAQTLVTNISDPFFLNTNILATLSAFYNHRIEPSFTREDIGSSFTLTRNLTSNLTTTMGYVIRKTDVSNTDNKDKDEDEDNNYDFASLKIQATYDTRNDLFFPTTGHRLFASLEQAEKNLGSDINFSRLTAGSRLFFRLTEVTVLGLRYTSGLLIPGRDQVTVPVAERFFNGGENTVRSFKEAKLGPHDSSGDPAGGYGFNVFNIELRQRIKGNLVGSLFFDYGNVSPNRTRREQGKPPYKHRSDVISDTLDDFFAGFRAAVGFGLQYLLPVGPARLDFAFNPDRDRKRNEDSYVIHFSVGMAF
ncbi:MAG: outer membrane protein assembly factor BamA [Deltaproteobacteria bacterium]|nr:outer membrane protein assembly factor BamA [Deltaproteobacteria bacterium]MBW2071756.1 outer membrane protein assembly factor BamA [Deltaproteobacteria bacterium]